MARVQFVNKNGVPFSSSVFIPDEIQKQGKAKALEYVNEKENNDFVKAVDVTLDDEPIDWAEIEALDNKYDQLWRLASKYGRAAAMHNCYRIGFNSNSAYEELYGETFDE